MPTHIAQSNTYVRHRLYGLADIPTFIRGTLRRQLSSKPECTLHPSWMEEQLLLVVCMFGVFGIADSLARANWLEHLD